MYVLIEIPGLGMTDVPELAGETSREVCRADSLPDLANAIEGLETEECKRRHAAAARTDPGNPALAAPHMARFTKALHDEARAAGMEIDEDDTPLAPASG